MYEEEYQQIKDMLQSEVLDAQFAGLRDSLQNATPQDMARIKEMMHALNEMLDADARGEHTQQQFDQFMQQYGEFFPDNPKNLAELSTALDCFIECANLGLRSWGGVEPNPAESRSMLRNRV